MNFHFNILPDKQKEIFESFSKLDFVKDFYLAGGTALALQIGHRKSYDLDFFATNNFDIQFLKNELQFLNPLDILSENKNTLYIEKDGLKTSFISYPYPLINKFSNFGFINIADITDIGCMKFSSIIGRGLKRDFVDLYFILNHIDFDTLLEKYYIKYEQHFNNIYSLKKSIVYFDEAEIEPMPDMIIPVKWEDVKDKMKSLVDRII